MNIFNYYLNHELNLKNKFLGMVIGLAPMAMFGSDPVPPFQMGVEAIWSNPTGALNTAFTSSTGDGLGVFLSKNFGNGHGYRWDIDCIISYPDRYLLDSSGNPIKTHFSSYMTTLSYVYHLNKKANGPYLLAGLGARRFQITADLPNPSPPPMPNAGFGGDAIPGHLRYIGDTGPKWAALVGGGYDFGPHWGVTVRFQGIQSMGHTLATLDAGFNFRF